MGRAGGADGGRDARPNDQSVLPDALRTGHHAWVAKRLDSPADVSKRDFVIGVVCVAVLTVLAIVALVLMSHLSSSAY